MPTELVRRIVEDPVYAKLHRKRTRLSWVLTLVMRVIYYGFILRIAVWLKTLAMRISDCATTLGFPLGAAVIVSAVILTDIYVRKANREFDRLNELLRRHLQLSTSAISSLRCSPFPAVSSPTVHWPPALSWAPPKSRP